MHVPITWKYQKDWIENNQEKVETPFPHHKTMGIFLDIQVKITPYYVVLSGRNSNSS